MTAETGQTGDKGPAEKPQAALAPKAQDLGLDIIGLTISSERKIAGAKYEGRNAFLSATIQIPRRADPDELAKNLFVWVNAKVDAEEAAIRAVLPPPAQANGNGDGNGQPAGQPAAQDPAKPPACPTHHSEMRRNKKDNGWYCPRKTGDKWCDQVKMDKPAGS